MKDDQKVLEEVKQETVTYRVGQCVIYRAEGICDIVDIRKETFPGREQANDYYILSPRNDPNSTLYVPVDNEELVALMRPLLSREEILSLCEDARNERMDWIVESRARNTRFREILSLGERREVLVLVNTVREHIAADEAAGKKPGTTDTGALRRGAKLLRDEFSAAIELSSDDALFALLDGAERE